ncbi:MULTISPECIES: cell envelope integrity protein CreD [Sphingobacterium]|uniref:Cell envelope integrity protein CreD n=1 Tax=Sphingobacterium tenebrionis TaxID=3111775 RepID=A0ABU8I848_9SPHI|nr:cell envelope integrity protein CreD [Sphingobacterium sp. CZ-2]QBR12088.1 cell envelope integrity protein CreD [Sphingobacterium sp. CZ-2]
MESSNINPENRPTPTPSLFDRITQSVILKIFIIFFLTLIMLIPLNMINELIQERKGREAVVSQEIAMKWGQEQVISGPILAVPYDITNETVETTSDGTKRTVYNNVTNYAFLMPNQVNIQAQVEPESRKRGIYETVVYTTQVKVNGDFAGFDLTTLKIDPNLLKWKETKLLVGIEDFKGLSKNPVMTWGNESKEMFKNNLDLKLFNGNLQIDLPLENAEAAKQKFSFQLDLRGSKSLNFLPLAKQTQIKAAGKWANPSFNGSYLPNVREVKDSFTASWDIPAFNRKLPAQWLGEPFTIYHFSGLDLNTEDHTAAYPPGSYMAESAVVAAAEAAHAAGSNLEISSDLDMVQINFLPSVNNYKKTDRVAKYGVLVIALTFVSLVFMEVIKKQRVHLIQYILIGFAMVLFYGLLLAISEHLGFNIAYLIASLATMLLIASFIKAITKNTKSALLFGGILSIFYLFIFVLLQLQDYSLIVGTVGIFLILAVLMRLSTKIDWYQFERK